MSNLPNVAKMVILSYRDQASLIPSHVFVVPINPTSLRFEARLDENDTSIGRRHALSFDKYLKFEILFDNTGAVQGNILDGVPVTTQVTAFMRTVFDRWPDGPVARNLRIVWGNLIYRCILEDIRLDYVLFDILGTPTRAKLYLVFEKFEEGR